MLELALGSCCSALAVQASGIYFVIDDTPDHLAIFTVSLRIFSANECKYESNMSLQYWTRTCTVYLVYNTIQYLLFILEDVTKILIKMLTYGS